jgi:KUP system potassium uptake protein
VFLTIELSFCSANLLKVAHGGWVPLLIGALVFVVMTTWLKGRRQLSQKLRTSLLPLDLFLQELTTSPPVRVPGTAVFMAGNPNGTPIALLHNVKHNKVLHERNVLLTVMTTDVAHVEEAERIQIEKLPHGFLRVVGQYGFMDEPNVPALLYACKPLGLKFNMSSTTFFLSQESIIAGHSRGMAAWRKLLFSVMSRNAQRATAFFHLPPNRVVELGMQVEL